MKKNLTETSNSAAFVALICLIPIFVVVVTKGWGEILKPLFGFFPPLSFVVAFFIAMAGVVLGKAVAAERIRISLEEKPKYKGTWVAYFLVLLIISALGTMNMLFMTTQGSATLANALADTGNKLRQLQTKAEAALATPEFDKKKSEIEALWTKFDSEMRNPANCGFGAESMQRFKELQAALPGLKPLSGVGAKCDKVPEVLKKYKEIVDSLIGNLAANASDKPRAYMDLRKKVIADLQSELKEIDQLKLTPSTLTKSVVQPVLEKAWSVYEEVLTKVERTTDKELDLEKRIVDQTVRGMGEISHIIGILISQWNRIDTYLIIFGAIFFDLILVAFFTRHLSSKVKEENDSPYTLKSSNSSGTTRNIFEQ